MKDEVDKILAQIEVDISEIDLYGYNIIETSLSMVHKLQTVLDDLRTKIQTYIFSTKEDEILFFKTQKPDTLVAVYPALQGTDAPPVHIFKNTAVYPADWLAENYRHYLKVRFVLQQLQMVQRAELVNFAPPRPHIIIQIIAPLVRVVETDFYLYGVFVFFRVLNDTCYH